MSNSEKSFGVLNTASGEVVRVYEHDPKGHATPAENAAEYAKKLTAETGAAHVVCDEDGKPVEKKVAAAKTTPAAPKKVGGAKKAAAKK